MPLSQREVANLMDGIAPVFMKAIGLEIAKAMEPLVGRLNELEARLTAGDGAVAELRSAVTETEARLGTQLSDAVGALPLEKLAADFAEVRDLVLGLPGPDGLVALVDKAVGEKVSGLAPVEIDPARLEVVVQAEVGKQVSAIPPAEPGKSVSIEDVRPLVAEAVAAGIAEIEVPAAPLPDAEVLRSLAADAAAALPARPLDLEAVQPAIAEIVAAKFSELRVPEVDPEAVRAEVERAVGALPAPPAPLPPPTVADLQPVVDEAVAARVEAAKGAVLESVRADLATAVAALPAPQDGKSVDAEEVRAMVGEMVAAGFAVVRLPKDGNDADPEVIRSMVQEATEAALPPIQAAAAAAIVQIRGVQEEAVAGLEPAVTKAVADRLAAMPHLAEPALKGLVVAAVGDAVSSAVAALPPPAAGKDADPEAVAGLVVAEVERQLAARPAPLDGKSVTLDDVRPLIDGAVQQAVAALPPPAAGKDVDMVAVAELVVAEVTRQVGALPAPEAGKSVTVEELRPLVEEVTAAAVGALPPPAAGKDADPEVTAALVVGEVTKQLGSWPRPADGKSVTVEEVTPVLEQLVEARVAKIPVPKDGVGLAGAVIDRDGELVVTLTDGALVKLGRVVGKNGEPGLGHDDLSVIDGPLDFTFRWARGEQVKEFTLPKATLADFYRGVWKEGDSYRKGEAVTWAGSLWIADVATDGKPEVSKDWKLAVKRGRDGKDGDPPPPAKPPKPIKVG